MTEVNHPPIDCTDDGYVLVPKKDKHAIKGMKCGECGMKFDYNKCYGFCCMKENCPIQPKVTL